MKKSFKLMTLCLILLSALSLCFACSPYSSNTSEPHEHVYVRNPSNEYIRTAATCTTKAVYYYSCEICGKYDINKTFEYGDFGHKLVIYKAVEPTCTESGMTEGRVCSVCNEVVAEQEIVPALGHDIVTYEGKPSTCTEKGFAEYEVCTRCDYTTYRELPLAEHDLDNGFCKKCGKEITPHSHIEVIDKGVPATCLKQGVTDGRHCSICNKILLEQEIIPAFGHNILKHEAVAATCTESGYNAYESCTRCNYSTYVEAPALGHDLIAHQAKDATCTELGWKAYKACSRCNYTTYESIPALGHDYISHKGKEAKCDESGYADYETCSRCDYTTYEEIPALGHSFGDGSCLKCGEMDPDYSIYFVFTELSGGTYSIKQSLETMPEKIRIPAMRNGKYITEIAETGFKKSTALKSVVIPHSITSIGTQAFSDCSALEEIFVSRENKNYYSEYNCLIDRAQKMVIAGCKNSSIPTDGTIEKIGDEAFYNCADLEQITIPSGVTSIGSSAFYGCSKLKKIDIPNSVILIGSSAFSGCGGLSEVNLGNGLTEIKDEAFKSCNSLTSIIFPNSITSIGSSAFSECDGITSIVIPENVAKIGGSAFYHCSSLKSVVWNAINCTYAGYESGYSDYSIFKGCNVEKLSLGNKVQFIPEFAYRNINCKSIIIPESVTTIMKAAFKNWSNQTVIYYMGTAEQWENISIETLYNSEFLSAERYYYRETAPTESGNYWHYDENGNPVIW